MAGPPENIAPDALWVALQEMPRPQRVVDYPRLDPVTGKPAGQVVVRPLSGAEAMSAAAEADRRTIDTLKRAPKQGDTSYGYDTLYNNESTVQILFRAITRVGAPGVGFFPSPDVIRDLPQDEIGSLMRTYLIVKRELGPDVRDMQPEEMDAWLEVLSKGGSAFPLARFELAALEALVMHSARRLYPSSTDTTSSTSPPESSSPAGNS